MENPYVVWKTKKVFQLPYYPLPNTAEIDVICNPEVPNLIIHYSELVVYIEIFRVIINKICQVHSEESPKVVMVNRVHLQ